MYERLQRLIQLSAGGDGDGGAGTPPAKPRASDLLSQYNGDAVRMAEKLAEVLGDNATLREQRRTLREEAAALKTKQAPEGAVILQGEDATAYTAYQALGKPADLTKRLAEAETATTRLTTLERDALVRDVAAVVGYKPAILRDRAGALPLTIKDVTGQDGKPVKRAFITPEGQGEQELTAYATAQWADYLPALVAQSTPPPSGGLGFPTTPGGGGKGAPDLVDQFITQRNEAASKAPNPLAAAAR